MLHRQLLADFESEGIYRGSSHRYAELDHLKVQMQHMTKQLSCAGAQRDEAGGVQG